MENRCIIFLFFFSYNDVSVVCFAFLYLTTLGLVNTFVMCSYHSLAHCKNQLLLTTSYLHEPLCVGNNVSVITLSVEYMEVEGSDAVNASWFIHWPNYEIEENHENAFYTNAIELLPNVFEFVVHDEGQGEKIYFCVKFSGRS